MPKLAIDLRSLNYPVRTGVNIYFLNVLKVLSEIKQKQPNIEVTGFGLQQPNLANLEKEFWWWKPLFNNYIHSKNIWAAKIIQTIYLVLNLFGIVRISSNSFLSYFGIPNNATHFFQPQIKSIIIPKTSNWLIATHDFFYLQIPDWSNWLKRPNELKLLANNLLNQCNQVWANSISTTNQIKQFFPSTKKDKIKLVYLASSNYYTKSIVNNDNRNNLKTSNSINSTNLEDSYSKRQEFKSNQTLIINREVEDGKYFIALAGIEPRKNWYNLLQAWKILEGKSSWNYRLVLAGRIVDKKYYLDLLNLIEQFDLKNIIWKLDISELEKTELLKNSIALVYPSLFEGFGFPILESWENNVSVIVGNMGSSMEIGQGAVLAVNPLDIEDIAAAMEILVEDEVFRKELIAKGSVRLKDFSWEEYKVKLEEWLGL